MDPTTILAQAQAALEAAARRNADLIRSLSDLSVPIPGSEWTVRESAVHLVNYAGVSTDIADGMPSLVESVAKEAMVAENARRIADIPETDPEKVAGLLTEAVAGLLEATAGRPGDRRVVFHAGLPLDLAGLVGISLGEQVLHGYDIATAVGSPWPIDPLHAQLVLSGYFSWYGRLVNPETASGVTAGYGIELRGGGAFTVRFVDGEYRLEPDGSGPVDCTISADPVAFLLVSSGRMRQWEAIALGLYSASGPRPELALTFMDLFDYP